MDKEQAIKQIVAKMFFTVRELISSRLFFSMVKKTVPICKIQAVIQLQKI